ncbi:hypothetical protein B0H13DRAFT_1862113 [Mycena leptocephala]|nr:hypothetical protein B0H13DRAFT_1862113 [Mycena leptocephala]
MPALLPSRASLLWASDVGAGSFMSFFFFTFMIACRGLAHCRRNFVELLMQHQQLGAELYSLNRLVSQFKEDEDQLEQELCSTLLEIITKTTANDKIDSGCDDLSSRHIVLNVQPHEYGFPEDITNPEIDDIHPKIVVAIASAPDKKASGSTLCERSLSRRKPAKMKAKRGNYSL